MTLKLVTKRSHSDKVKNKIVKLNRKKSKDATAKDYETGVSGYYELDRINDGANSEIKFHLSRLISIVVQGWYKSRRDNV